MTPRTTLSLAAALLVIAPACEHAARPATDTKVAAAEPTATPSAKPAIPPPAIPVPEAAPLAAAPSDANYPTNPDAMPRVPAAEAAALRDAGKAVILDVRDTPSYESNHIAGALGIPLAELPQRLSELPRDKRILTYCA